MIQALSQRFVAAFLSLLEQERDAATDLREAALAEDLTRWTKTLTALVVRAFTALGMPAAAKGHRCAALPVSRGEYLGQDVMAFGAAPNGWRLPLAVCELENSPQLELVAYSLWKVLCVRCALRVVFCYRARPDESARLVSELAEQVVSAQGIHDRQSLGGETLLLVGSRDEAQTFPYGFFSIWKLNLNTGRFERFARP